MQTRAINSFHIISNFNRISLLLSLLLLLLLLLLLSLLLLLLLLLLSSLLLLLLFKVDSEKENFQFADL